MYKDFSSFLLKTSLVICGSCRNQRVVILGAAASGTDLAMELASTARHGERYALEVAAAVSEIGM
jgi:hypothetical protein